LEFLAGHEGIVSIGYILSREIVPPPNFPYDPTILGSPLIPAKTLPNPTNSGDKLKSIAET
jgi:hypothetical protein